MIALIAIPHQAPARIQWYDGIADLLHAATCDGRELPDHGFDSVRNAAHDLAEDWHGYILVESAADLAEVRSYVASNGRSGGPRHQALRVSALLPELEEHFSA